ncbi:MAG: NAD(P)H-hydrate dehydratase [Actinomycetota bacterium]|nr:NAD(P)H-hydrate dehydratase [Actinomycetota bacterium]
MPALPHWLEALPNAEQMRATDTWAIERQGIASLDLMERAGAGLARVVGERAPRGPVSVVCGKGNNGGDGLVAARLLRESGREVEVLLTGPAEELQGDPRANLERLPGPRPVAFAPSALEGVLCVVDALLGTGFCGSPREPAAGAIDAVNRSGATVVAADVPSGVDASTGTVAGAAVRADATATFHAAKPGLWIAPGKQCSGEVRVIDIGIPGGEPSRSDIGLILSAVTQVVPRRHAGSTKFSEGAVLVVGGSPGLTGAPSIAAEAAARAGAGYVTAAVPASLSLVFELRLLEVMTRGLADTEGAHAPAGLDAALEAAKRADAMVLGPGLGRSDSARAFACYLAARAALPLVLDADGLNAHAGGLISLAQRSAPTVLTPHAGELGRLLEIPSEDVEAERLRHAREAAAAAGAVVVLKGDDTLVVDPVGRVAVSPGASPALATAGTGDVLSGAIGALLAKRLPAFDAACAGVALHAEAGRRAAGWHGPDTVTAGDVIMGLRGAREP